jgi:hypothetical protein
MASARRAAGVVEGQKQAIDAGNPYAELAADWKALWSSDVTWSDMIFGEPEEMRKRANLIEEQMAALLAKRGLLVSGEASPTGEAAAIVDAAGGMPPDADAFAGTDKLADIRARVARAQIELYEEEHDRAMAMEQLEYDDRVRKSDGSQESLDALLREHELRRQKITRDRDDKLAAEKKRQQEKAADEAARAAEQRAEYEQRIAEQREDAEIDAMPDARTRELKRLEVDERRELARAAELGADPAAVSALFAARRNLVTAPTASEVRGSSTGTFSAAAAAGMGSGNYASRTAEASEATARFTRRIDMHLAKFGLATT